MSDTTLLTLQDPSETADEGLMGRRWLVFLLNAASLIGLGLIMGRLLSSHGWSVASALFMTLFLLGLPWTLLGFWNSVIGFVILRLVRDPVAFTNPAIRATPPDSPIVTRTAICLAVRHEAVAPTFARLQAMIESIEATGWAAAFDFHVLSDSARPEVAVAEEQAFALLKALFPTPGFVQYRRRSVNTGFKAGNLREFATRAYGHYEHMIVLDADSVMSAASMLRLVRAMQANPTLGILQTLVVGRPSDSGFTRIFQFGMRHAMRTQTVGSAWWQGSSGPYWGHNAIIRVTPFVDRCELPVLAGRGPLGGQILSHDQVEAAMMRGAGYEVRVIADEFESWEENPPSLPDFIKRDLRWCQGNMQYLKLLRMPGLRPMGRFQLVNAIMMYAGAPMSFLMLTVGLAVGRGPHRPDFSTNMAFALYFIMVGMGFAPRMLGMLDVLLRGQARRYGGVFRLVAGSLSDAFFSLFIGPVMMIAQAVFVVGLAFGRRVIWEAQNRDGRTIRVAEAARIFWPQGLFGMVAVGALIRLAPGALPWATPTILPCLIAVPFTCVTAGRLFGRALVRLRLCAIPDEYAPAPELLRIAALTEKPAAKFDM